MWPYETVWSGFGRGYLYIPLVLPMAGLWWLWQNRPWRADATGEVTSRARPRGR